MATADLIGDFWLPNGVARRPERPELSTQATPALSKKVSDV